MKHTSTIFDRFLHSFRELFIYHHDSLEFRAKVYTLPIVVNIDNGDCELEKLDDIVEEIYPESLMRQNALILTVKEYIHKVKQPNGLGIDELIFDIERIIKRESRFVNKINLIHIDMIASCTTEKESIIYQKRVSSYLERLKNQYLKNRNIPTSG